MIFEYIHAEMSISIESAAYQISSQPTNYIYLLANMCMKLKTPINKDTEVFM